MQTDFDGFDLAALQNREIPLHPSGTYSSPRLSLAGLEHGCQL